MAIAMTTLLYSLTSDPREGFDFHAADLLLPVLLLCAVQLRTLQMPSLKIVLLGGILVLSSLWSENVLLTTYSAGKLFAILCMFSALRTPILKHRKQFFIPIIVMGLLAIPWAIVIQLMGRNNGLAWGFSGNPNIAAGHSVVLLLSTSIWLAPFWAVLLATTGSRAAILALTIAFPFLLKRLGARKSFATYSFIGVAIILLTLTFSTYYRIIPVDIGEGRGQDITQDDRWKAKGEIEIIGSGYDTTTQWEDTNPHNIYLQLLTELGVPFGILTILLLLSHIRTLNPTLIAILTISFFDHYWLTTGQGMYLLAAILAMAQREKEIKEAENVTLPRRSLIPEYKLSDGGAVTDHP